MLMRHRGIEPAVHPEAYIAATAVLVGDVRVAAGARVLHGAVLSAEDGHVSIGEDTVVMENALVRGRAGYPAVVGSAVMVGPHAHINGSIVGDEAFIATGASLSREAASAMGLRSGSTPSSRSIQPSARGLWFRSGGLLWVAPHRCSHRSATTKSGPSNENSVSDKRSTG